MNSTMKNIVIIDVDALMPSRLGVFGNIGSVSPTLDKLAKTSLNCTNAFSMGNPTEFALPGLFASAYLLDCNGYRYGISDNQTTFAETLRGKRLLYCGIYDSIPAQKR